jgi:Ser/Thr protein kinase RdoA (MazF antagonist)
LNTFPVVHSVLAPAALLDEIASQYSLGVPRNCVLLRSWINEVYQLQIESQTYILKVYRRGWRSPEELAYEIALMQHLEANGLVVSPPIARRNGDFVGVILAPEGERSLALYPYLVGDPPLPPSETVYDLVARTIGAMHRALEPFTTMAPRPALDVRYLAEEPLEWLRPYFHDRPADWDFLTTLVERVRSRLSSLDQASGLSWGPIHGDATLDNLLVTDDRQIGIYDFDQCGPGWRGYELQGFFHYAWIAKQPGFWSAIVNGYRSEYTLGEADLAAMPCFVVLNRLWCMGFEANIIAGNQGKWIVNSDYFDNRIEGLRHWDTAYRNYL